MGLSRTQKIPLHKIPKIRTVVYVTIYLHIPELCQYNLFSVYVGVVHKIVLCVLMTNTKKCHFKCYPGSLGLVSTEVFCKFHPAIVDENMNPVCIPPNIGWEYTSRYIRQDPLFIQ